MGTKPNLNPSRFSNFISYSLFGSHFSCFLSLCSFPIPFSPFPASGSPFPRHLFPIPCSLYPVRCSPFPVPRSPFPVPRSTLNNIPRYIQHIFLQCRSPLSTGGSLNTILRCITKAFLRVTEYDKHKFKTITRLIQTITIHCSTLPLPTSFTFAEDEKQ